MTHFPGFGQHANPVGSVTLRSYLCADDGILDNTVRTEGNVMAPAVNVRLRVFDVVRERQTSVVIFTTP